MPKQNLILSLYDVTEHAQKVMKDHGITYQVAVPQSLYDCWMFFNCENVPDPLPDFLSVMKGDPHDYVGRGLSKQSADAIVEGAKE